MFPLADDVEAKSFPDVTYFLIFLLVCVFGYQCTLPTNFATSFIDTWGFTPAHLFQQFGVASLLTLVTAIFLHGGWSHLIGNAFILYLVGDNVEDNFGRFWYLLFFLLGGIVGNLAQAFFGSDPTQVCIGASGAISAAIGAYLVLYPEAQVSLGFFSLVSGFVNFKLPALIVILLWYILQFQDLFLNGLLKHYSMPVIPEHVAHYAHIGGFLFGATIALALGSKSEKPDQAGKVVCKVEKSRWTRVR